MNHLINPLEKLADRMAEQGLPEGMIILDGWETMLCSTCSRIKVGRVIEYRIRDGDTYKPAPIPYDALYCHCEQEAEAEDDDLARIVTLDEAAFVKLMEEARK